MKRLLSLTLMMVMVFSLSACGKSDAAQNVDDQISAIGEVTLDSESKITEAESALAALSQEDRDQVDGAGELAEARTAYDALVVEETINAIGTVTLDSGDAISAARAAYDSASAEVQAAVSNADQLAAAETAISDLRVQQVSELIGAIGEVTLEDGETIRTAQDMLEKLSDEDAAKVANAGELETASKMLETIQKEQAEGLLSKMRKEEDKVQGVSFYYPSAWKFYADGSWVADQRCFLLPYIGRDSNRIWMRMVFNYTGDDWVFFDHITVVADGERFSKSFKYFDMVHDNGGGVVWEYIDVEAFDSDLKMLRAIANSSETIIRFEGDDYLHDLTVKDSDKAAIREALAAYEAFK